MRKPKNRSYWNFLSAGTTGKKTKWWFTIVPGVGYAGISLGKTRKRWFNRYVEYLIMYRTYKNNICFDWIEENLLIKRD